MDQNTTSWKGRVDGTTIDVLRWHQTIEVADVDRIQHDGNGFFGLIGFAVDEGVRRNNGRIGAQKGPEKLRTFASNFPSKHIVKLIDYGDIICHDRLLEVAQHQLKQNVSTILTNGGKSIVLGGGHELMYGHYAGLRAAYPLQKIGIINFDAHFDNRVINPDIGPTSGTGFWQVAQEDESYEYLAIGIQENSNTPALFNFAKDNHTDYILAKDFHPENGEVIISKIDNFLASVDVVYVTVCMDVFSAPFAPGVSAVAYNGIIPDYFFQNIFGKVISTEKVKAFDIAEVNPEYDIDNRTARLGASFIFEFVSRAVF